MSKKGKTIGCVAVLVIGLTGSVLGVKAVRAKKSSEKTSTSASMAEKEWTEAEKEVQKQIEGIYDVDS